MTADVKSQPVDIVITQALNYLRRPTPEYEAALDLCVDVIKRAPTYIKGIVMMS